MSNEETFVKPNASDNLIKMSDEQSSVNFNPNTDSGEARKLAILIMCLHIFQQLSFINGYFSYTKEIFGDLPNIYLVLGVANFVGVLLRVAIEYLKNTQGGSNNSLMHLDYPLYKKYIAVISAAGSTGASFLLFFGFFENIAPMKYVAAFCFIFCFSFGFGPIPWRIIRKKKHQRLRILIIYLN